MDFTGEIILTGILFASGVIIIYILARYNFLIRKQAVEKGFNPFNRRKSYSLVEIGCIVLNLGIGFGVCSIYTTFELSEDTFYLLVYATMFICGGIGLIGAHFIRRRLERK